MTVSIFLKVWQQDYEFLKYCLRSIVRFASGFKSTIIVSDFGSPKPPIGCLEEWYAIPLKQNGYAWQQAVKVNADAFTTADFILYMDADTVFTKPFNPEMVMDNGLPVWLLEPYEGMTNVDVLARKEVMGKFLGETVQYEFMRRHPFIISRELLSDFRRFCWRTHGVPIEEYLIETPNISEFNMMGCWAYNHRRSSVSWKSPVEMPVYVRQAWSHGGLTDEIRNEFEEILK